MRFTGKVISFSPQKEGVSADGREWKKRSVVLDTGYTTEEGDQIRRKFVADTFKEFTDEQLEAWMQSQKKLALYINFDAHEWNGAWYQDVTLSNINEMEC